MVGIMVLVMAIVLFIGLIPTIKTLINTSRGCSYLNCAGFVDSGASGASCTSLNQTYTSSLEEDSLSCTIIGLGIPYLILGVLVAGISLLLANKLGANPQPEPMQYGGY